MRTETRQRQILAFIRSRGEEGATDREIAEALGLPMNKIIKLRVELWNQDFIGFSGRPRPRKAIAWMALPLSRHFPAP